MTIKCMDCDTLLRCEVCLGNALFGTRSNFKNTITASCMGCERREVLCVVCAGRLRKLVQDQKLKLELYEKQALQYAESVDRKCFFLSSFEREPRDPDFSGDFVFEGRDSLPVLAHRIIMAGRSPVLRRMFKTNTDTIKVDDATAPTLRAVVEFCCMGSIAFTEEASSEDVLKLAYRYQIPELMEACDEHLAKDINEDNFCSKLRLAHEYSLRQLLSATKIFFRDNLPNIYDSVTEQLVLKPKESSQY